MGKQMEGDNQRRRALARQARATGRRASETGATLGAGKQLSHQPDKRRAGPPAAGSRKPSPGSSTQPAPTTAPPDLPAHPGPTTHDGLVGIGYRELVAEVGRRTGIDFTDARAAAEATVVALARALSEADRQRLLDAVPPELHDDRVATAVNRRTDLAGFLDEIARLSRRTPEQARYQAQATLHALAAQDGDLLGSLDLPADLRELVAPPPAGGDGLGPDGQTAPLAPDELAAALDGLPYWRRDGGSLSRTIELPPANLDRVLDLLGRLKPDLGRGPSVGRPTPGSAVLTVRTSRADGVTALDVDLAHRVDAAIDEAGAGIS